MTDNQISLRQINKIARRLQIQPNTLLLIKEGTELASIENIKLLTSAIGKLGVPGVVVGVIDDLDNIKAMPEPEMNKAGWWKIETLRQKILRQGQDEDVGEEDS